MRYMLTQLLLAFSQCIFAQTSNPGPNISNYSVPKYMTFYQYVIISKFMIKILKCKVVITRDVYMLHISTLIVQERPVRHVTSVITVTGAEPVPPGRYVWHEDSRETCTISEPTVHQLVLFLFSKLSFCIMLLRLQLIFVFDLNRSMKCDAQTLFVCYRRRTAY